MSKTWLARLALLGLVAGLVWFWPEPATPPRPAASGPADWPVVGSPSIGVDLAFRHPAEYELSNDGLDGSPIYLFATSTGGMIVVAREAAAARPCYLDLCDAPAAGHVQGDGIAWDVIAPQRFCAASDCGDVTSYYRATAGRYAYYVGFSGEARDRQILQTVRLVR